MKTIITLFLMASILPNLFAQDKKLANKLFDEGDYEAAIDELQLLLEDETDNVELNYMMGICYLNTNIDKGKAVPFLAKVTNSENPEPNSWYLLGRAYAFSYEFKKAIDAYQKFKNTNKGSVENIADVDKEIEYSQNAIELMKYPIDVTYENLGKNVNTLNMEYYPFVPSDESYILFNTRKDDGSENLPNGWYTANVYISKVKNGVFQESKQVSEINTPEGDEEVTGLSADGKNAVIYMNNFDVQGDLFKVAYNDEKFASPTQLPKVINSKYTEIAGAFSPDGNAIYFASDRPEGYGGVDIYKSQILPNGEWGPAQNLGPSVNTEMDEDFPNLTPDGKILYFSSKGHTSMGGYDIFKAVWDQAKHRWGGVRNVGFSINTPDDDMNLRMSENGRYGYIAALRKEGFGNLDIYRVTFNQVEPRYTVISGVLSSDSKDEKLDNLYLMVTDNETQEVVGDYLPNPNSMRYVIILPPGKYQVLIAADNYEDYIQDIEIFDKASYRAEIIRDITMKSAK